MSIDSPTAGMPSADAAPTLTRRAAQAFTAYRDGERDRSVREHRDRDLDHRQG